EDPIRILRALRLSHRLDFAIEPSLRKQMEIIASALKNSVLPRSREEILKILHLKTLPIALIESHDLNILEHVFPSINEIYKDPSRIIEFNMYLKQMHRFVLDTENPAELFSYLMLAYYRSTVESDPFKRVFASDVLKNEKIKDL